jgi:hypothetical protein
MISTFLSQRAPFHHGVVTPSCPEIRLQQNALIPNLLRILLWGRFLIVLRIFGWADSINEREEADGGGHC